MTNMSRSLNDQARRALKAGEELARAMNHEYVGTEHILLGLLQDEQGIVARALDELGADAGRIRREIEQLVVAGAEPVTRCSLPLTPRAKRAISFTEEDLWILQQDRVGPEHLVFGLLREPDGVAGQVLRNMGVDLHQLGKRVFAPRLNQLKFVEQIVRPVRASTHRKRKLREELLGHLTAICNEEQVRFADPAAALHAATERFGIPAELTHEIETSLPVSERFNYFVERHLGWRAPESTASWMLRLSAHLFCMFAATCAITVASVILLSGSSDWTWKVARGAVAFVLLASAAPITLGQLNFKVRDAMFGIFGQPRSRWRVIRFHLFSTLAIVIGGFSYFAVYEWNMAAAYRLLPLFVAAGFAWVIISHVIVRWNGLREISDVMWECLDLQTPRTGPDEASAALAT
jgi:hypothetical protein